MNKRNRHLVHPMAAKWAPQGLRPHNTKTRVRKPISVRLDDGRLYSCVHVEVRPGIFSDTVFDIYDAAHGMTPRKLGRVWRDADQRWHVTNNEGQGLPILARERGLAVRELVNAASITA